jgi:hypothetical protein
MSSVASDAPAQAPAGPKGLGGWLILPLIGTCLSPWFVAWSAIQSIGLLSTPGIADDLRAFILAEIVANALLALLWLAALVLMFMRKRAYPRLFIAATVATFLLVAGDLLIAAVVFNLPPDASDIKSLARSLVGCAIWVPYMLVSKRVANTFVN